MTKEPSKLTLADVAREAQVSVNTAAKVLAGRAVTARISKKTQRKVKLAAKKIGYIPNISARNLRSRRTGMIGVFIADMSDSAYTKISQVVLKELHNQGLSPLLTVAEIGRELCMREWLQNRIEGLILCGTTDYMNAEFFNELKHFSIAAVIAGCAFKKPDNSNIQNIEVSTVSMDNNTGMQIAINHLIEKGRKKIAHLAGPKWHADAFERQNSYENIIEKYHQPIIVSQKNAESSWKMGYQQTAELNNISKDYDAIIAYDDQFALGAIKQLIERKIKIPEDIAVVGFDNSPESESCIPSLTTVAQPLETIGKKSTALLKERLSENKAIEKIQVAPMLVVRESTQNSRE